MKIDGASQRDTRANSEEFLMAKAKTNWETKEIM